MLSFPRDPCGNHCITVWNTKISIRITARADTTVELVRNLVAHGDAREGK